MGDADAGVSSSTFDDCAGCSEPSFLGLANHPPRGAVFDRTTRVHELGLAEDLTTGCIGRGLQTNQRRIAYRFDKTIARVH